MLLDCNRTLWYRLLLSHTWTHFFQVLLIAWVSHRIKSMILLTDTPSPACCINFYIFLNKLPVKQMARIEFRAVVQSAVSTCEKTLWTITNCLIFRNYCSAQNNSAIYSIWLPSMWPKSPLHRVDSAKASDIYAVLYCAYISSSISLFLSLWVFFTPSWTRNAPCLPEQTSK